MVNPNKHSLKILFPALALILAALLAGCAHEEERPWHKKESKWYQSDMDSEDRSFFIDSFFDRGTR
ncbi:MAG: hypothetical protein WDN28_06600 [Chthoniobacter sp.]